MKNYRATTISAVTMCLLSSAVSAALPIFTGPGGSPMSANGFRSPSQQLAPGTPINNLGTTIGRAEKYVSSNNIGYRPLRWAPGAAPQELGSLNNAVTLSYAEPYAINTAGTIVGYASKPSGGQRAVRYAPGTTVATELGVLSANNGVSEAQAYAINTAGVAIGYSFQYQGNVNKGTRPVKWLPGGTSATELGIINFSSTGVGYGIATAMNDAGTIGGSGKRWGALDSDLGFRPLRWSANGFNPFELDVINLRADGYGYGAVYAMNAASVVVGYSNRYAGNNDMGPRPTRWNTGGTAVSELAVLGTDVNGATTGYARDINNSGVAVGWVNKYNDLGADLGLRATRWNAGGVAVTELGNLGTAADGTSFCVATSINESGTVSGACSAYAGNTLVGTRATLWVAGSNAPLNLNTLIDAASGWTLTQAYQVTDTGFVTGSAQYDPDGAGAQAAYARWFTMLVPQAGTYGKGDANFDTLVNFDDLLLLSQRYGLANAGLSTNVADFNLDGTTDFADLLTLSQNYAGGSALTADFAPGFAADWALAQSLVPEPASLVFCLAAAVGPGRRRR